MTAAALVSKDALTAVVHRGGAATERQSRFAGLRRECGATSPSVRGEWLAILQQGLGHTPYCVEASQGDKVVGVLPLSFLNTRLFGKFLVGMPYLNVGGVIAQDAPVATKLLDEAVQLEDDLDVRYLELRHELRWPHPALNYESSQKVHMRLELPGTEETLWDSFKPKVRNQIRKAEQNELTVIWGGRELLREFYDVFAVNMRDLGTPVYSRRFFEEVLSNFSATASVCLVDHGDRTVAGAIALSHRDVLEVPWASSLREYRSQCPNNLLYWKIIEHGIDTRHSSLDFGRSTPNEGTYHFKEQWGAQPEPLYWEYVMQGDRELPNLSPSNPKYRAAINLWTRLPVGLTKVIGPHIVRSIP